MFFRSIITQISQFKQRAPKGLAE